MAERPILFSGPMVRALLNGSKTQTRRVLKPQPGFLPNGGNWYRPHSDRPRHWQYAAGRADTRIYAYLDAPYAPGDRLWVREKWSPSDPRPVYAADPMFDGMRDGDFAWGWKPSIHMPRWASRLTLTVTDVRVQRVQEITHSDALAEGVDYDVSKPDGAPAQRFQRLWNSLNRSRGFGWDVNPWVVAVTFTVNAASGAA